MWAKTHALLRTYAERNGGPRKMMEDNRAVLFGNSLYEQHLVYLALYDTFGEPPLRLPADNAAALSLGLAPYFVQPQVPGQPQWIEEVASAQQVIQSDFGMSMNSLFLVASVSPQPLPVEALTAARQASRRTAKPGLTAQPGLPTRLPCSVRGAGDCRPCHHLLHAGTHPRPVRRPHHPPLARLPPATSGIRTTRSRPRGAAECGSHHGAACRGRDPYGFNG